MELVFYDPEGKKSLSLVYNNLTPEVVSLKFARTLYLDFYYENEAMRKVS